MSGFVHPSALPFSLHVKLGKYVSEINFKRGFSWKEEACRVCDVKRPEHKAALLAPGWAAGQLCDRGGGTSAYCVVSPVQGALVPLSVVLAFLQCAALKLQYGEV